MYLFKLGVEKGETVKSPPFKTDMMERPAVDVLNQLGSEGWEVIGMDSRDKALRWGLKRLIELINNLK